MLFEDFPFNETEGLRVSLYFTNTVQQLIVDETNRYAQQYLDAHPEKQDDRFAGTWTPLDIPTLKRFFGLLGIVKKPSLYVLVYEQDFFYFLNKYYLWLSYKIGKRKEIFVNNFLFDP